MSSGIPLKDEDRWGWLETLRKEAIKRLQSSNSVIVTCSALKKSYRDVIRVAHTEHPSVEVHFVYLKLDEATLKERMANREGHFMKTEMIKSQIAALEEPVGENDVFTVDVKGNQEEVCKKTMELVKGSMSNGK
jgi:gluconokinase